MVIKKIAADFKPHKIGLKKVLGELEADIMEICWQGERVTVRDVYEKLRSQREIAYTTVMTIMSRLAEKNLLSKETQGNAFIYTAVLSKLEFTKRVVGEVLDGLLADFAEPAISHFVDRMGSEDEQKINQLEILLKDRLAKEGH